MNKNKISNKLISEFEDLLGIKTDFSHEFLNDVSVLCKYLEEKKLLSRRTRHNRFVAHVNWKFRTNAESLRNFYKLAAISGFTFNYHEKREIQLAYDDSSKPRLKNVLDAAVDRKEIKHELLQNFDPYSKKDSIQTIKNECQGPSKLRKPQNGRNISREILESQFAAFLYCSLSEKEMHGFFDPEFTSDNYKPAFWDELHARHPELFSRNDSLEIIRITPTLTRRTSYERFRNKLAFWVRNAYERINNYGHLAIIIEPITDSSKKSIQWELASDLTLFSEKHRERSLKKTYFRENEIREITSSYIKNIDTKNAAFEKANEGFFYKDCFVFFKTSDDVKNEPTILLLFQKNERDETLIPCPKCRSQNVQGNSYPTLGVRSWECKNRLCPDRSKYNRGKRYSFKSILMQQAIDDPQNSIASSQVRAWSRDVQYNKNLDEVIKMLIQHYSLSRDAIHLFNVSSPKCTFGRNAVVNKLLLRKEDAFFEKAALFNRYLVERPKAKKHKSMSQVNDGNFKVFCGDSFDVLFNLEPNSVDGAVTSPPYYNAREYTQWPNIYCYLYDMFNVAKGVWQILKPGSFYLFNIFDYFDNENSIVFSAMGQKRMILSAYIVDAFRRVGFNLYGNIVWDKGEIEGKRGFNAGNFSPYYQSPFNCWEHILVFQKPTALKRKNSNNKIFPTFIRAKPVIKMIRGENIHGHSAPFPDEIPGLLINILTSDCVILDPYAGSLTTGRFAEERGLSSIQIEKNMEYCTLGLDIRKRAISSEQQELLSFEDHSSSTPTQ